MPRPKPMNPAPPDAGATLAAGARLAERFEIRRFLSSGASGEVYAAFDHKLGEDVAIKLLRPEIAHDARVVERFRREIQLSRRVAHPNVCRTFNLERQPGAGADLVFVSMQLLEGETLEARLSRGPLAEVGGAVAAGQLRRSHAAHAQGVIHRDRRRTMLCAGGARAYITGLRSRLPRHPAGASRPVSSGPASGTPHAMAPEQVEDGALRPWIDVYALGVLAHCMVNGRLVRRPTHAGGGRGDGPAAAAVRERPDLDLAMEAAIRQCCSATLRRDPASGAAFVALLSGQAPPVAGPRRPCAGGGGGAASAATLVPSPRARGRWMPVSSRRWSRAPSAPAVAACLHAAVRRRGVDRRGLRRVARGGTAGWPALRAIELRRPPRGRAYLLGAGNSWRHGSRAAKRASCGWKRCRRPAQRPPPADLAESAGSCAVAAAAGRRLRVARRASFWATCRPAPGAAGRRCGGAWARTPKRAFRRGSARTAGAAAGRASATGRRRSRIRLRPARLLPRLLGAAPGPPAARALATLARLRQLPAPLGH